VVQIDVDVATHPDEFAEAEIALLREHRLQRRRAPTQFEWRPEQKVDASLIEQTRKATVRNVILIDHRARRQRHLIELGDVPRMEEHPSTRGIRAQHFDQSGDLVVLPSVGSEPTGATAFRRPVPSRPIARQTPRPRGCGARIPPRRCRSRSPSGSGRAASRSRCGRSARGAAAGSCSPSGTRASP
jgi:hypothetical protein